MRAKKKGFGRFGHGYYVNTAIKTVPAVNSAKPHHALNFNFSLKTISEKKTVINILNLSIGTTTLT